MDHQPIKCELKKKLDVQRITPQRILIFDIIKNNPEHFHVEEIYALAKNKDKKINLSTIYRTLSEFKKAGIVDELHLEEDHHHLICGKCGSVIDFKLNLVNNIGRNVAKKHGFKAAKVHIQVTGLCRNCA